MIGTIVNDRYEIQKTIAESHQFEIFSALERETGATVVVKIMREELCINRDRVQVFCEEVRSFAALTHPAIVHVLDMDMFEQRPYVVTELIEGQDLKSWMQQATPGFKDAAHLIQEVATVLQYACNQKVAQRSIKISNIFRTRDGSARILSFSHPRLKLVREDTRDPDEASGIQSDLFSLGTMLYELISGDSPIRKRGGINELWEARLRQAMRIRHPHLTPEHMDLVVDFIDRTLTRNVQRRFETHAAFLIGLSDLIHVSEGALRKERQSAPRMHLSSASEVVDAIQGRFQIVGGESTGATAQTGTMGSGASRSGSGPANLGHRFGTGTAALAVDPMPEAFDDGTTGNVGETGGTPNGRPRLTLLKGGAASQSMMWRKADQQNVWWRNPLLLMGTLLGLMVLLILFW